MQLRNHSDIPMFREAFDAAKEKLHPSLYLYGKITWKFLIILPLSEELYTIFQEIFFMRITNENLTFKFAERIAINFLIVISAVKRYG